MRTTQRLYEAAHPIWEQCHDHPFVRGIGDGSLDLEKFRWFLLQDYLYLFDYARVFAYGVVKARDPGLMRTFSANVDAILGGEMKVHRAYMARLGITEEQVFSVQPALSIGQAHVQNAQRIPHSSLRCLGYRLDSPIFRSRALLFQHFVEPLYNYALRYPLEVIPLAAG